MKKIKLEHYPDDSEIIEVYTNENPTKLKIVIPVNGYGYDYLLTW